MPRRPTPRAATPCSARRRSSTPSPRRCGISPPGTGSRPEGTAPMTDRPESAWERELRARLRALFADEAAERLGALDARRAAGVEAVVAALEAPDPGAGSASPPPPARPGPLAPGGTEPAAAEAVRVPVARLERLMADVRELHAGLNRLRLRAAEAR